jgi:hypothetical protein
MDLPGTLGTPIFQSRMPFVLGRALSNTIIAEWCTETLQKALIKHGSCLILIKIASLLLGYWSTYYVSNSIQPCRLGKSGSQ